MKIETENRDYISVIGNNGKKYNLNKNTFAALSNDLNNPLSLISLSNSSFSIDMWRGCIYHCAYCHVQGCYNNLKNWSMTYVPERKTTFSEAEVIDALVEYTDFVKDESLISIATSSTEPFANEKVSDSTIALTKELSARGYKNPFWIVTKGGIILPKHYEQMEEIIRNGNKIIVSICWTNNKPEIEPSTIDRFSFVKKLSEVGVHINWYMRPLAKEWNATEENINYIMSYVKEKKYPIDSITAGGLRWTSGIEFGMEVLHGISLPELEKDDNKKTLDDETIENIKKAHKKYLPNIPLFFKSSCGISYALNKANFNLVNYLERKYCGISECPLRQMIKCSSYLENVDLLGINEELRKSGFNLEMSENEVRLSEMQAHNYQEKVMVKRNIVKIIKGKD